ncbi:MAG: methyltransferase [Saprospiraceae bacterium]
MTDNQIFKFKKFTVDQSNCTMKVGTDGILLGAWCDVKRAKKALDIGTGSGLISLMIVQRNEAAIIDGVEIDETSYNQAKRNFMDSDWHKRLNIVNSSIQDFSAESKGNYNLIVCNPPFFSGGTLSSYQNKNYVRHTIKLSHQDLLKSARKLLSSKGIFCVILPLIEGLRFVEMAETYGMYCNRKTSVFSKKGRPVERLLLEFSKEKKDLLEDNLVIYKKENDEWTLDFIQLTREFYLKM